MNSPKRTAAGKPPKTTGPAFLSINLVRRRYTIPTQRREALLLLLSILAPLIFFSLLSLTLAHSFNRGIISRYEQLIVEQEARERERIREIVTPTGPERELLAAINRRLAARLAMVPLAPRLRALAKALPGDFRLDEVEYSGQRLRLVGNAPAGDRVITDLARMVVDLNRDQDFVAGLDQIRLVRVEETEDRVLFLIDSR